MLNKKFSFFIMDCKYDHFCALSVIIKPEIIKLNRFICKEHNDDNKDSLKISMSLMMLLYAKNVLHKTSQCKYKKEEEKLSCIVSRVEFRENLW